jgi:polysaccharide deacetylase 2 family uncharacterized protein YibQ
LRNGAGAQPLLPAPDPALVEDSPYGKLPVIGRDGRRPWQVYARPFDRGDKRPRVAVLMTGLGVSDKQTQVAVERLPAAVTLAFDPYPPRLPGWIEAARRGGHEVLLELPMEPLDYPRQDPGPLTLLTALDPQQNIERLNQVLGRAAGYVGLTELMGARFVASRTSLLPVLDALRSRGLLFVDGHAAADSVVVPLARSVGLPWAAGDAVVDAMPWPDIIDKQLAALETAARRNGAALGVAAPYPASFDRLVAWAATLDDKGLALAPVSAIAAVQPPTAAKR